MTRKIEVSQLKPKVLWGFIIIFLAIAGSSFSQSKSEESLRDLIIRYHFDEALEKLKKTESTEIKTLWQLAYCYYKKGKNKELIELLKDFTPDTTMRIYRDWLLGEAYLREKKERDAIKAYANWKDATFPYLEKMALTYFDLLIKNKMYAKAESTVYDFKKFGNAQLARVSEFKMLELKVKTEPDSARKILTQMFKNKPTQWVYNMLKENFSPLGWEEYLKGSSLLYDARKYEEALQDINKCLKLIPKTSPRLGEALFARATIYTAINEKREKGIAELKQLLQKAIYDSAQIHIMLGSVYRRIGKEEEAIKELGYWLNTTNKAFRKAGLWNLAELYRQRQSWSLCAPLFAEYWRYAGRDDELADNSVLWAGLAFYLAGEYDSANYYFSTIIDQYGKGYETFEETAHWWKAKSLIAQGKYEEASCTLDSILALPSRGYYYYRTRIWYGDYDSSNFVQDELEELWALEKAKVDSIVRASGEMTEAIPGGPNLTRALFFSEIGILEWGEKEFQNYIMGAGKGLTLSQTWAALKLAESLGYTYTAFLLSQRMASLIKDSLVARRLQYPLFYIDKVLSASREFGISPFLLLAMIRQESAFELYSTSRAMACGLAQITPNTGKRIANELKLDKYSPELLYDYELNIRMGAYELKRLLDDCGKDLACALARYNGGDSRMAIWQNYKREAGEELFLENIDYHETRHYTKRIIANYYAYLELWKPLQ